MSMIKKMVTKGFAETRSTGDMLKKATAQLRDINRGNKAKVLAKMSNKDGLAKAEKGEKAHTGKK